MTGTSRDPAMDLAVALLALARRRVPPVPAPIDPAVRDLVELDRRWLPSQAAAAVHGLLSLGATTEQLYALARHVYAAAIADAVGVLDGLSARDPSWRSVDANGRYRLDVVGELHDEVWSGLNELRGEDLTG